MSRFVKLVRLEEMRDEDYLVRRVLMINPAYVIAVEPHHNPSRSILTVIEHPDPVIVEGNIEDIASLLR